MKLQVFGTGCPKCQKLAKATQEVADELGLEYELEKVTDINKMVEAGIMVPPALAVDGTIKVTGRIPSNDELKEMLQ